MIRFFIDYSLCSLDSVELAAVEDELSVEEPFVDEAVVELLVDSLVSSVSASKSLERASQYFLYLDLTAFCLITKQFFHVSQKPDIMMRCWLE